jgi:hypothetical protein
MWQVVDSTLCWVPLCLYLAEILCTTDISRGKLERRTFWLSFAGLAASMGMMLVAGHEQFAVYGVLVVIAYILTIGKGPMPSRLLIAAGTVALAGLISAVQVLPTMDLLQRSLRGQNSLSDLLGTAMPPNQLAMLFMPEIVGGESDWHAHMYIGAVNYYELTCYVGVAAAVFATFAFYKPTAERRRQLWLWGGVGIFGLLVGCGTPLYSALYYALPIVKSFHGVARTLVLTDLAVAVLAAYGVQTAIDTTDDELRHKFFGWGALGVGLVAVALYGIVASQTAPVIAAILTHDWLTYGLIQLTRVLIIASLAWVAAVAVSKNLRWLAVVVAASDMLSFAAGLNPGASANFLYPKLDTTAAMIQTAGAGRVICLGGQRDLDRMIPNSAESLGLRDVSGSDPLMLANYDSFVRQLNTATDGGPAPAGPGIVAVGGSPALNYLNVTAVISPEPISINNYSPVYLGPDVYIYTNTLARGEAWLEDKNVSGDTGNITDLLHGYPPTAISDSDLVKSVDERPERITAEISASHSQTLVFSEIADGCWKATIDGAATAWSEVHGLLIGVPVPAGDHIVSLRYLPQAGMIGLYLTGIGWLIVAWIVGAQIALRPESS